MKDGAILKNPFDGSWEPHEMTFAEFSAHATARKSGRPDGKWKVSFCEHGCPSVAWPDAAGEEEAKRAVHRRLVSDALHFNTREQVEANKEAWAQAPAGAHWIARPSLPPFDVLDEYPDIAARFPEALRTKGRP